MGDVPTNAPSSVESTQRPSEPPADEMDDVLLMDDLKTRLQPTSTATELRIPIGGDGRGIGPGMLVIPGWIRERAVEVLFDDDAVGEADSLPSAILQTLLKVSYRRCVRTLAHKNAATGRSASSADLYPAGSRRDGISTGLHTAPEKLTPPNTSDRGCWHK